MKHCIYAKCLMNGSNHLDEADDRPFALCPVCSAKWVASVASSRIAGVEATAVGRERAMLAFFESEALSADAAACRERIAALTGQKAGTLSPGRSGEVAAEVASADPVAAPTGASRSVEVAPAVPGNTAVTL